jgi:hypothetical protein
VRTAVGPDGTAALVASAQTDAGTPIDLARAHAVLTRTEGAEPVAESIALRQTAPGTYEGTVRVAPGAYPLEVVLVSDAGVRTSSRLGLAWSGPAELVTFAPPGFLEVLAAAGGGRLAPAAALRLQGRPLARTDLWPWFFALAAGAWLVDVARQLDRLPRLRRGVRGAVPGWRPRSDAR